MDIELKAKFEGLWEKYFGTAELPIVFFYTNGDGGAEWTEKPKGRSCLICELSQVRKGRSMVYNAQRVVCGGAKRFLGYSSTIRPGFEYFLSCGNENMEGERYIQTPAMVNEIMAVKEELPIEGKNLVFKRWDKLEVTDEPDGVIFFATPDVLSGLFTLNNFDQTEANNTFAPFGAGCASIVFYPYLESKKERQRAVIGMFDPSARPCVPANVLSFALPFKRFTHIIGFMEETFLITPTWTTVKNRINRL
jgi:uncharacterized protein (DUF169 family)